jgi:hypothetical protein
LEFSLIGSGPGSNTAKITYSWPPSYSLTIWYVWYTRNFQEGHCRKRNDGQLATPSPVQMEKQLTVPWFWLSNWWHFIIPTVRQATNEMKFKDLKFLLFHLVFFCLTCSLRFQVCVISTLWYYFFIFNVLFNFTERFFLPQLPEGRY